MGAPPAATNDGLTGNAGRRWRPVTAMVVAASATAMVLGSTPVVAATSTPAPGAAHEPLWPADRAWGRYVLGQDRVVHDPVDIRSVRGRVSGARELLKGGSATLEMVDGGEPAILVLDYGVETAGYPQLTVDSVTPDDGATGVQLRQAYSESMPFMYTPGTATVSVKAPAGTRKVRYSSGTNLFVGDTVQFGAEQYEITGVGTADAAVPLAKAAPAGATRLQLGSLEEAVAGQVIRVGGAPHTIVAVDGAPTSINFAPISADMVAFFGPNSNVAAGDVLTISGELMTVAFAQTQPWGTLASFTTPLPTGATSPAHKPGPVTITPALANDVPVGTQVILAPGTGLTLSRGLAESVEAGTAIRTKPGMPTGYTNNVTTLANPGPTEGANEGGFRFRAIALTKPGKVTISAPSVRWSAHRAGADDYAGHFLSSDETLNKAWFAGAFTNQTNMVPAGVDDLDVPVIYDGAKRDRALWSGDLIVQGRVAYQAFGAAALPYWKGTLDTFMDMQNPVTGELPSSTCCGIFYATTYSAYAAMSAIDYYRYAGDLDYARSLLPAVERAEKFHASHLNENGLIVTNDPDYWQTRQDGEVTHYSMVYLEFLQNLVWFENELGHPEKAARYAEAAERLKANINDHLWSDSLGAYIHSDVMPTVIPADANSDAIRLGVAPRGKVQGILDVLRRTWTGHGNVLSQSVPAGPSLADGYGHEIEPLTNTWESEARYVAGDTESALELTRDLIGPMVDESSDFYTGALWEFLDQSGIVDESRDSLAHGWGAGQSAQLLERLVGVRPTSAGYHKWLVEPMPATSVDWADGSVPTPSGPIDVLWGQSEGDRRFDVDVTAPAGTSGQVSLPLLSNDAAVQVNGHDVWVDGKFVAAPQVDGAELSGDRVIFSVRGGETLRFRSAPKTGPTPPPVVATPTPTQAPAVDKVVARIGTKVVKPVEVGTKVRLRVTVRARGVVPSGSVEVKVRGAGKKKSYEKSLNSRGRTKLWLPVFKWPGRVAVKVRYMGDSAVEAQWKKIAFAVVDRRTVR